MLFSFVVSVALHDRDALPGNLLNIKSPGKPSRLTYTSQVVPARVEVRDREQSVTRH